MIGCEFFLNEPLGVVCNDAGGANQIFSMIRRWGGVPAFIAVEGPAKTIWMRDFSDIKPNSESNLLWVNKVSTLITGTGWASYFEHKARLEAKRLGVHSIAVLDHWVNYPERFIRGGEMVLPDELWVVDSYAAELARQSFLNIPVNIKTDCYAEHEVASVAPILDSTPNELLYLLEPARSDWGREEPGEFQALRYFLQCVPQLGLPKGVVINLRPHPSDNSEKYNNFLCDNSDYSIRLACGTLAESLSQCRWVAGCQTYAMTLALRAGRAVYGTLPPWGPICALPHKGIVHLRSICPMVKGCDSV